MGGNLSIMISEKIAKGSFTPYNFKDKEGQILWHENPHCKYKQVR